MNQSKVLVAGTGISGIAAAKLVLERGGEVVLYDGNTALNTDEIRAKFGKDAKVGIVLGEIKRSDLLGVELCIISPGIPLNSGFVAVVDEAGIPVLREIELPAVCSILWLSSPEAETACCNRNQWKDHYNSSYRRDLKISV